MTRVRNAHGAPCHGLAVGAEGEVDEGNLGVAAALAGGLLVRVEAAASPAGPSEELRAASERIEALSAENARLQADLEAATAPAKAEGDVSEKTGRSTRKG